MSITDNGNTMIMATQG